jgi:hypothetical protein
MLTIRNVASQRTEILWTNLAKLAGVSEANAEE